MASIESLQQGFASGATRSADEHKIDFEGHISPEAMHYYGEYMHKNRTQRDGRQRASDNWQLGIPLHKYMKSLVRHTFDLWRAWRGSVTRNPDNNDVQAVANLLSAIIFNAQGMLDTLVRYNLTGKTHFTTQERVDLEHGGHPSALDPAWVAMKQEIMQTTREPELVFNACPQGGKCSSDFTDPHYTTCYNGCMKIVETQEEKVR